MQCLMLIYLPDMTSPHNGGNVNDSSEVSIQRYHTNVGGGGECIILFEQTQVHSDTTIR